jgi:hypothetical protein
MEKKLLHNESHICGRPPLDTSHAFIFVPLKFVFSEVCYSLFQSYSDLHITRFSLLCCIKLVRHVFPNNFSDSFENKNKYSILNILFQEEI